MTFTSAELKEYLNGDTIKARNYFAALRRYILVETKTALIGCNRHGVDRDMFSCVMYCSIKDANRIANIKLQSNSMRTNKEMWNNIKEFTDMKLKG